jgi:PTS system mannose-specific IIC component
MNTVLLAFILALITGLWVLVGMLSTGLWMPLILAVLAGLIVGDVGLGMKVGALCSLMFLGFYTYGGATTPDYNVGALFGVFVAHQSGDIDQGIVIGSIIALLMSWFDILGRASTTVFQHGGDRALARRNLKSFEKWHMAGTLSWGLARFIPVFIGMLFLDRYVVIQQFVENYAWFQRGLSVIGSSLPAVGFALLLSYMDIKRYWPYMLAGYVLFAFIHVPTIGLAIVGVAAAGLWVKRQQENAVTSGAQGGN